MLSSTKDDKIVLITPLRPIQMWKTGGLFWQTQRSLSRLLDENQTYGFPQLNRLDGDYSFLFIHLKLVDAGPV